MNAAIYVRVSTDQQAEKGYSIDTQLAACRKYALELGATNIQEFIDDGYSGEFIDRPALTRLREGLAKKAFNIVISYAPDRLSRNTIHLLIISEEITKAGAMRKFASVNFDCTPEGELMYKFQGIVAEYEKEKIKERTMRGKRGKATKGLVISNAKPFGYTFNQNKSTYEINTAEAAIIKMIFDLIVNDKMGTARICKELNSRGIPSPRAKKSWIVSTIHRILTNTIYKGIIYSMKYRYEKIGLKQRKRTLRPESEWIPIKVPAIIDEVTWQAAQKQLQENKNLAKRNLKHNYLLNGLVTCAKCGRSMVISHSGCINPISYYTCLSQKSSSYMYSEQLPCTARQVPTKILDEYVFDYLLKLCHTSDKIIDYIQAEHASKDVFKQQTALKEITTTQHELQLQKNKLLQWFRQKILTELEAETQLQVINQQLADISELKKNYEIELAACSTSCSNFEIAAAIKLSLNPDSYTLEEKKAALRSILAKVIVERIDTTRGRGSQPELIVQLKLK